MKIDDAIKHCYEVAETSNCGECAEEHLQLAEWLEELKKYKEQASGPMTNEEYIRSCTTEQLAELLADQYNDVVDFILREVDEYAGDIEPDDYWYRQDVVVEWLKQPHKENG